MELSLKARVKCLTFKKSIAKTWKFINRANINTKIITENYP